MARARTYREADAFRELASSSARPGEPDWCSTLVMCATDLATVPDGAVFLRGSQADPGTVHASGPDLRAGSVVLAESGWDPLRECMEAVWPVTVDPRAAGAAPVPAMIRDTYAALHLFPVSHRGDARGVLMVCDRVPDRLGARQADALAFIGTVAGLLLSHETEVSGARRLASELQHALDSRLVVEQAKGYLAGRDGHDMATAFRALRETARRERRLLADVARETLPH